MNKRTLLLFSLILNIVFITLLQTNWKRVKPTEGRQENAVATEDDSVSKQDTPPQTTSRPNQQTVSQTSPQTRKTEDHLYLYSALKNNHTHDFLTRLKEYDQQQLIQMPSFENFNLLSHAIFQRRRIETRELITKGLNIKYTDAVLDVIKEEDIVFLDFLSSFDININGKARNHPNYPLHFAVRQGDPKIVRILLKMNARVAIRDSTFLTAYDYARQEENLGNYANGHQNYEEIRDLLLGN